MTSVFVLGSVTSSMVLILFKSPLLLTEAFFAPSTGTFAPSTYSFCTPPNLIHSRWCVSRQALFAQSNSPDEREDSRDGGEDNVFDPLIQELRYAKSEMLGKDIPVNEELQRAAQNAENAFLSAMLEQTQQFKQIKQEVGSDRAVEAFMQRIQEEQNPRQDALSEEGDVAGEEDAGDSIANKWFVHRMQEEQNPIIDTECDEFDDAWQ